MPDGWTQRRALPGALAVALLMAALPACTALTSEEPPVSDSTMVEVLIELHLAAARNSVRPELPPAVRDSILAQYGLDTARFEAMTRYYAEHPEAYVALYTKVVDRLNEERSRLPRPEDLPPE